MKSTAKNKIAAAAFASALLVFSMLPFAASAEATTSGDYSYEVQGGGAVILRYMGEDEELIVPAEIDGNKVTEIGSKAFEMKADIVSLEIPDGVTKIGDHAFAIDRGLETITLPSTVTEIGEAAFQQCEGLKTVNFAGDEAAFTAISVGAENDLFTAVTPNYNVALTEQTTASEAAESESASSEEASSAEASSEEVSSAEASSEETSSAEAASEEAAAETTSSEEAVPQGSSVNPAYVVGGILVGIALIDIIYFSAKKPTAEEVSKMK